ncbi:MAG TPA: tetratricopeptide repeat protein [Vicinamibacterales bacterium]|jgi:TolA-binding protein|nr:tetratricopeptide repeat protein [Vicinamibacterales bacterium]
MSLSRPSPFRVLSVVTLAFAFVTPAAAQSREQRQLMADVRILQEQNQTLQNLLNSLADAIKTVNARIDEQAGITGRAFADQKLIVTNITNSVREVREKLDDNTVRLGSLSEEVDAVRQGLQQLSALPAFSAPSPLAPETGAPGPAGALVPPGPPPAAAAAGDTPTATGTVPSAAAPALPPPSTPPPAAPVGTSPQKLWDVAYADYTLGQWDLAISGFQAVIMYFPRAERAADAQVHIGHSYLQAGNNEKAVEAYDAAIANYPGSPALPDAYYRRGLALKSLKQLDAARASFEYVVKTYPESTAALLARQQIAQPKP